ncbi:LacI family transcriptional regulator [Catalinimonas alkaloidigena]|uniref:LacI family transcriptional regulator n=1 Tax=Catalinimonas alkaloidigena TaxID=1075417 RepID=A0A1G9GM72_9BACT|nr:LacI family DNA-binding transcriptional regulator [Catalinimonas alkaloidigena]SDL01746.1 LacI family transcriptional regulator [Catalinimonas alkaloidigena]
MKKKRVSIIDIARELNVTPSTVSRALNGSSRIGEETRRAVMDLAEKWGYRPNPFAKSLLLNKTFNVGLIIPEFTHHFFNSVLSGIESVMSAKNYHLIICTSDDRYEKEKKSCQTLMDMRVDGILAAMGDSTQQFDHFHQVVENGVPLVFIDRFCEDLPASYVTTDDFNGAQQAVTHLLEIGCRRIAHLRGPANVSTSFNRYMGYQEALRRAEVPLEPAWVIDGFEPEVFGPRLKPLVEQGEIDAIFAFNDYLAYDALKLIEQWGKRVPDDLCLMGYADEPVAEYVTPSLSTVRQPAYQVGQQAARFLLSQMEAKEANTPATEQVHTESLTTELVLRESTRRTRG